jgi:hypothetical protein
MAEHPRFARRTRVLAVSLAAATLFALAALVSLGFGNGRSARPYPYQYQYKVTICHHTHSPKNPTVTIVVDSHALPAHLKHGDTLGPCP